MEFYTLKEIQPKLAVARGTLYRWLQEGLNFPFLVIKIGNQYRIPKADFDRWYTETYTLNDVHEKLGVSMSTLYKWIESGAEFPFTIYRFGKQYRIPKPEFDKWAKESK